MFMTVLIKYPLLNYNDLSDDIQYTSILTLVMPKYYMNLDNYYIKVNIIKIK